MDQNETLLLNICVHKAPYYKEKNAHFWFIEYCFFLVPVSNCVPQSWSV